MAALALVSLLAFGCATNSVPDQTLALTETADQNAAREQQMRRFDTSDTALLLSSSAQLLQDLGFSIDEAKPGAGFLMASKDRDAVESGQVAGQVLLVLLAAAVGVAANPVYEKTQRIRVLVAVNSSHDRAATVVHATFQRVIWDNHGHVSRAVTIDDASLYQSFFDKLAQSTFLTANNL